MDQSEDKNGNDKNEKTINDILQDLRKSIKPSTGPLTSIDPKKLAKAAEDVEIAKEVAKIIKKSEKENGE